MRRLLATIALAIAATATLLALPAPATAQGFDISKGIVGNLASQACREQGDCGWCDFVDLMVIIQKIILYLFGGLAICMIIWGGFGIVTAAGNQEKITSGRKLIVSTLFGILIILAAYFTVAATVGILQNPTDATPTELLGKAWWHDTLQCYTPLDGDDYCATAPAGSLCYKPNGSPWACDDNGKCTKDACSTKPAGLGDGATCDSIDREVCATSGPDLPAKRNTCFPPNCKLNVCSGSADRVCCKAP